MGDPTGPVVQGVYNMVAPSPSAGAVVALQTDSAGNLKVTSTGGTAPGAVGPGTAAAASRTTLASDDPLVVANHVDLAAILAKLSADPATQTTLAAILAKIIAAPATEASLAAALAVLGATSGAAVITDANGTAQQYLRGLVKQWIAGTLVIGAGENHLGEVGGNTARVSVSFTRPSDTTAYASGDLAANSTTAGSVVPMSFAISRAAGKGGMVRRARLRKTGTSITNASFRLHLYSASPTVSNGDNGAWLTDQSANYVGSIDITCDKAFTDGAAGNGVPNVGSEINFTSDTYYGLLEARAAYTPGSAEQFTLELEMVRN